MTRLISLKFAIKFESIEFELEFLESIEFELELFESEWAKSEWAESEWAESEWAESEWTESEWTESKCLCIFYFRECRKTICDFLEWRRKIEKSREYDNEEHTLIWSTLCRDRKWQNFFIVKFRRSLKIFSLRNVDREMMKMQMLKMLIASC